MKKLTLISLLIVGCLSVESAIAANSDVAAQNAQTQTLLDGQTSRAKRMEVLTDEAEAYYKKQEQLQQRYEKILARWEAQQDQYQKYLDGLKK